MHTHRLEPLFRPRSVAVVGASEHGAGRQVLDNLALLGFAERICPVNPRRSEVAGLPCVASIGEIPDPVDAAVIAVGPSRVPAAVADCAAAGVPAAVVFAAGFSERGHDGAVLERELREHAEGAGMALLGPNCMGYMAPGYRTGLYMDTVSRMPRVGEIAVITQSGSVGVSALNHTGTFGLSAMVSVGNEAVVSAADVIDYLLGDGLTRVIAVYAEGFRDAPGFVRAAEAAAERDVRVVLCKSGRSPLAAAAAESHTGALATDQRVVEAVLGSRGVVLVDDVDELYHAAEILATGRRFGPRVGAVTLSGGHVGLLMDVADPTPLRFQQPESQRDRIEAALDEPRVILNPLDTWSSSIPIEEAFDAALRVLASGSELDTFLAAVDSPADPPTAPLEMPRRLARITADVAADDDRLWLSVSTSIAAEDPEVLSVLRDAGIPRLTGLRATIGALAAIARVQVLEPSRAQLEDWGERPVPRTEPECYAVLGEAGIPVPRHAVVSSVDAALAAGAEIGYPVVAKLVSASVVHKSDVGGVIVGITGPEELERGCGKLLSRGDGSILVAEQAAEGLDLFVGARVDPSFGPIVVVGLGGVLVELIDETMVLPAPIGPDDVQRLLSGTKADHLLAGARGGSPLDRRALAGVVAKVSELIAAIGDPGCEIDINPVRVFERGVVALDAAFIGGGRA